MNINTININDCIGCFSCVCACPKKCIEEKKDKFGFYIVEIDSSNCIECGICLKSCPVNNGIIKNTDYPQSAFIAYNKDENVVYNSSSGGVFTLLAQYVLNNDGVVYGAAYDEDFSVAHIRISDTNDIGKLVKSKYSQSNLSGIFSRVKQDLQNDRLVLFTGTPCQVSALKVFLNNDFHNLYTQDLICHGTPSPMALEKYIKELSKRFSSKVSNIDMRNKKSGWEKYNISVGFCDGTEYVSTFNNDPFFKIFLKNYSLRTSCYNCKYRGINRNSDITLGDFWGVKDVFPEHFNFLGTSAMIINNEHGCELFAAIKNKLFYHPVNIDTIILNNPCYSQSVDKPDNRENVLKAIKRGYVFDNICKKYVENSNNNTSRKKIFKRIKYYVKKIWRKLISKN